MKYAATATIAILAVSSWEWSLPVALVIGLAAFWREVYDLYERVRMDRRVARLRRALAVSWHVSADARTAFEMAKGSK